MSTETHKFSRRQADIGEIERAGWFTDGDEARSPVTGAWYSLDEFYVANSATIDGEQQLGKFLYLDAEGPVGERFIQKIGK